MIKIIYAIGHLPYGGAEKLLLDLCTRLDKKRFAVSLVIWQENNPLLPAFEKAGVKVKMIKKNGRFDGAFISRLSTYFKAEQPDIVHTHLFAGDFWAGKAARLAGVKTVVSTKHDVLYEGFLRSFLGARARRKCLAVIAISEAVQAHLIRVEKIAITKVKLIYNGIDFEKFYQENNRLLQSKTIEIGSVGRLVKEKGYKHLLRACRFIKTSNWHLTLVGDGELSGELKKQTELLGLENQVTFTGFVKDIKPFLEKIDIFVLPSTTEGLSLSVLEAGASGKLLITTDIGGLPEIIDDRRNGLMFKPKNIERLARLLNWSIENPEEARHLAGALQAKVKEKFDLKKTIPQYEKFYENIAY